MTSEEPSFIHVTVVAGEPVEVQVSVLVIESGSKVRLVMLGGADKTKGTKMLVCADRVHELLKAVKKCVTPVPSKYMYKLVDRQNDRMTD